MSGAVAVAASSGSLPAIAASSAAASATVRVIGPAVSWVELIGRMPVRLTRPTVGRRPTTPWSLAGLVIEPLVSLPIVMAARPAAAIAPLPLEEPLGVMSAL